MSDKKANTAVLVHLTSVVQMGPIIYSVFEETNSKGRRGGKLPIFRIRGDEMISKSEEYFYPTQRKMLPGSRKYGK